MFISLWFLCAGGELCYLYRVLKWLHLWKTKLCSPLMGSYFPGFFLVSCVFNLPFSHLMTPHSSTLAWKIPWTGEPGRLKSIGSQRVGHDLATKQQQYTLVSILGRFNLVWQRRQGDPTPVLLPGKSHGWRSLVGFSPWGCEDLDITERLRFHISLSCIGEGNENPLQCSCLENPRNGGAWLAAVYGVTQSQTRLKRLSSSSSSIKVQQAYLHWYLQTRRKLIKWNMGLYIAKHAIKWITADCILLIREIVPK